MDDIFGSYLDKAAAKFRQNKGPVRVVSHFDSDGIAAASILIHALNRLGYTYSLTFVKSLDRKTIDLLSKEDNEFFVFTDLGSGQTGELNEKMTGKNVFILDHHIPGETVSDFIHINPVLFGFDGTKELSGAGVVYFFCKYLLGSGRPLPHIAFIGLIGDRQDKGGVKSYNKQILDEAVEEGEIEVEKGVRFFGRQTRPLYRLLRDSTNPYIPGVTGSEQGTKKFLDELGIDMKSSGSYRKITDLDKSETKKLISGIIKRRKDEKNPKDIFGNIYTLVNQKRESPYRDAKEFSTLLNACGRMGKASVGMFACLGDRKSRERGVEILKDYKKEILRTLKWYEGNKENVYRGRNYVIVDGKTSVMPELAGTFASIISYSRENSDYIMTLAQNVDGTTKVSFRYAGRKKDIDIRGILKESTEGLDAETGGHDKAAGAIIKTDNEKEFIERVKKKLERL
ncbi:MAG: DHHA1 domain-containing protein [Nanobdellota archaeon]